MPALALAAITIAIGLAGCDGKQNREADFIERGKAQYAQREFVKAALEFRNALQINPIGIEAQYYLGLISEKTNDLPNALQAFTRVTEQDPKNIPAQIKLSQYALLQDNLPRAMEKAKLIIALDAGNAEAHALRGAVLLRQDKLEEAMQEAIKAQAANPKNTTAISVIAGIKAKQGNIADALKTLDAGISQNPTEDGLKLIKLRIFSERNDVAGMELVLRSLIATSAQKSLYRLELIRLLSTQNRQGEAEQVLRDAIADDPNDKDAKLLLIQLLNQQHGLDAAEVELLAFTKAAPDDFTYLQALAELYAYNGKFDKAKAVLTDIVAKDLRHPNTLVAKAGLARLALAEGDQAAANELIANILADDPQHEEALLIRAGMELSANDMPAAVLDLRAVLRIDPHSKQALLLLIKAYADSGEGQLRLDAYKNYLVTDPANDTIRIEFIAHLLQEGNADEAEKQIAKIRESSPLFVSALMQQVDLFILRKNWTRAIETAHRIIQDIGNDVQGRTALGKIHLARGELNAAIDELQHVYAITPGHSLARTLLVQCLLRADRAAQAVAVLTEAVSKDPKDAEAFVLLGDLYFVLQRPEDALKALRQSISIRPDWDVPYLKLVSLYFATGRLAEVAETARAGLTVLPNHPQLLLNLGMVEDARGRFEAARDAYQAVLKKQPRNAVAANNLAALLADAWPKDQAQLEEARRLVEPFRNGDDPYLLDTLGWVQYRLGNFSDAVGLLERSAKADPQLAQVRYHLGMTYEALGNQDKARIELERATAGPATYRGFEDAKLTLIKAER